MLEPVVIMQLWFLKNISGNKMKKIILVLFVFIAILFWGCATTNQSYVVHDPNPTFGDLNNYGEWINVPGMGTVWRPYNENDWQPYADGYWAYTDDGWMWVSNEPYGWIVYHYGYWNYDGSLGWVWTPSYDWSPARVRWYHSGGYIGWAPIPPPTVNQAGFYNSHLDNVWVVIPEQNFISRDVIKYRNRTVTPDIEVIRSQNGGRGPDVRTVEQITRTKIEPVKPIREELTAGAKKIIKVRMPENRPFSPSTVRDENKVPATNPPVRNEGKPVITPPRPIDKGELIQKEKVRVEDQSKTKGIKKEGRNPSGKKSVRKESNRKEPANKKNELKKPRDARPEKGKANEKRNEDQKRGKEKIIE